jgi:acyl-CoA hydrolase
VHGGEPDLESKGDTQGCSPLYVGLLVACRSEFVATNPTSCNVEREVEIRSGRQRVS